MKKLIAGLLGLVLSVMCALPSVAQNLPSRIDSYGIGGVSYSLNSGGSYYGQVFNSATAAIWSLGFGSSRSTAGTGVLTWDKNGHTGFTGIGISSVSACGSSNTTPQGADAAGDVNIGTGSQSSCTITFANAYTTVPHCFCNNRTTAQACFARPTTTALVMVGSQVYSFASGDALDYTCIGN